MRAGRTIVRKSANRHRATICRGAVVAVKRMRGMWMTRWRAGLAALLLTCAAGAGFAAQPEQSIVVASTTSTQDSGLFNYLLPIVQARTGIAAKVVAQGTGQALETA